MNHRDHRVHRGRFPARISAKRKGWFWKEHALGSGDWREFLKGGLESYDHAILQTAILQTHERTGRPLGDEKFVDRLESTLGRVLKKGKPGPKKAEDGDK